MLPFILELNILQSMHGIGTEQSMHGILHTEQLYTKEVFAMNNINLGISMRLFYQFHQNDAVVYCSCYRQNS